MKKNNVSKILKIDPYLEPFKSDIELRASLFEKKRQELLGKNRSIVDFASGYEYYTKLHNKKQYKIQILYKKIQ